MLLGGDNQCNCSAACGLRDVLGGDSKFGMPSAESVGTRTEGSPWGERFHCMFYRSSRVPLETGVMLRTVSQPVHEKKKKASRIVSS